MSPPSTLQPPHLGDDPPGPRFPRLAARWDVQLVREAFASDDPAHWRPYMGFPNHEPPPGGDASLRENNERSQSTKAPSPPTPPTVYEPPLPLPWWRDMGRLAFIVNGIAFGVLIFAHLTGPSPIFPKGGDEPGLAIASGILFGANIVYLAQKLRAMAAYQEAAKLAWAGGYAQNKALDMLDVIQYHFNLTDAEALKRQREARTAGRAEPPKRIILAKNVARLETEEARPGWRSANVLAMLRKARRMPLEPSEGEK